MRRDIDYRTYDPARFKEDHPDDPVLLDGRARAEALSAQLSPLEFQGTPLDQQREIEQRFNGLETEQWDRQERADLDDQRKLLQDYTYEKTDAIHEAAHERVMQARNPEGQRAAWEGTKQDVDHARETAASDPEYLRQQEQLTQFHAARSEAISHEIYEVQNQHLADRGLDQTQDMAPEAPVQEPAPEVTIPAQTPEAIPQEVTPEVKVPDQTPEAEPQTPTPEIAQRSAALSAYDKIAGYKPDAPSPEQSQEKDAYEHEM